MSDTILEKAEFDRLVVVASMHGEKFIGSVPSYVKDRKKYLDEAASRRQPIILQKARLMLSQVGTVPGADGMMGGIQTAVALIPIDLASGPLEEIHVNPSSWYYPADTPAIRDSLSRLLKQASDAEMKNRAVQAGLHVAGGPGGSLVR